MPSSARRLAIEICVLGKMYQMIILYRTKSLYIQHAHWDSFRNMVRRLRNIFLLNYIVNIYTMGRVHIIFFDMVNISVQHCKLLLFKVTNCRVVIKISNYEIKTSAHSFYNWIRLSDMKGELD